MEAVALKSDYEIERGKPMPSKLHAALEINIGSLIRVNYRDQYRAFTELTIQLPSGKGGTPDIAIYPKMELDWQNDEVKVKEPPLGVIEIFSPTQGSLEIMERKPQYFALGVKSMWIVNPPFKSVYVYYNEYEFDTFINDDILEDKQLGISLPLKEIFS
jgi:hypothetical protein